MIQTKGDLFKTVQTSNLFPDSKTFVDAIPKRAPNDILNDYQQQCSQPDFNIESFVFSNFTIPKPIASSEDKINTSSIKHYIQSLWPVLTHEPDESIENDTLIPLPHPYIVPGGRFREFFYWDTYFTAEGLATVDRYDIIENMLKNFAYLQDKVGLIPNGTRWYFATRSQPPVLGPMVNLLYEKYGIQHIKPYLRTLEKEFEIWTTGGKALRMPDGSYLSRYWDKGDYPREDAYKEDTALAVGLSEEEAKKLYRNLRSGAESGWDFTARWLKDSNKLETIQITDMAPIDLNALVYDLAILLAQYHDELGNEKKSTHYKNLAEERKKTINTYCWNEDLGFYFDYVVTSQKQTNIYTMAGAVPLFVNMASSKQADAIEKILKEKMLKEGGFVSTLIATDFQWDSPNGWAPLQWFGVKGLLNYNKKKLAIEAIQRWVKTMEDHFAKHEMLMEKYNVIDPKVTATGGEYLIQEGFGWTNGVALKFFQLLDELRFEIETLSFEDEKTA